MIRQLFIFNKSNFKHNICKIKHIFMIIVYNNGYDCIYMSIIKSNYFKVQYIILKWYYY